MLKMVKLTKRIVDDAPPREAPYFLWDDAVRGFGLRIFPTGRKAFYVDYRTGGDRKRMLLGAYGPLTVEESRRLALSTLGGAVKGDDPLTERRTQRNSMTVAQLCEKYLAAVEAGEPLGKRRGPKKASTVASDRSRINNHIIPLLGRKRVKDLTTPDLNQFMRDVAAKKTAASRGRIAKGPGGAARTISLLGGILSFAISEGVITQNPAHAVKRPADGRRTRRLSREEFARLGRALAEASLDPGAWRGVAGVKLLILTGARLSEITKLRWSEVDLEGRALRLDDSKEGASVRPLGAATVAVLDGLPSKGGEFVLPGIRAKTYGALPRFIGGITKAANLDGVTAHTFRHAAASVAADLEYAESTIAALLGHSNRSTTSRYIHKLDSVLIAAADRVTETITSYMAEVSDNV